MRQTNPLLTVPRVAGIASLKLLISQAEVAELRLATDLRVLRRFLRDARKALKQTLESKDHTVTYTPRRRRRKGH